MEKWANALKHLTKVQIEVILDTRWVGYHMGAYANYSLPHKPKANKTLVIILENYFHGDGTHWMRIYHDGDRDVEFFDSFVMRLQRRLLVYAKDEKKHRVRFDYATRYK